ncbi:MAG: VCBS repeat-containing protein, partial [Ignavibacteria bacterium]|nr:VCBS repeat-containing protein [Ignavibacteria bacterium]
MKRVTYFFLFLSFLYVGSIQAQLLTRTAEIKEPSGKEVGGFGGVIAGVDFDKDGKPEIYACNTNMVDRAYELVPRIYKFELNPVTAKWDSVWSATSPLEKQNTWPAFTWGDLDKDGRPEIYWAPVNFSPYPDVARILVYEYPGDGSDNMGVADGLGGFLPNAMTNIIAGPGLNIRPIKFVIADPDNDGKDELIFVDRQPTMHIGVLSISDIPNLGGGTEKWTVEFDASTIPEIKATSAKYDVAVLNGVIYAWDGSGRVVSVKYSSGTWKLVKVQTSLNAIGSFKGSQVVDINNDGKKEILLADWFTNTKGAGAKVWLLQQNADTLQGTALVDLEPL